VKQTADWRELPKVLGGVTRCWMHIPREHIRHDGCVRRIDPDQPMALL
jgi:hypothetical protein